MIVETTVEGVAVAAESIEGEAREEKSGKGPTGSAIEGEAEAFYYLS